MNLIENIVSQKSIHLSNIIHNAMDESGGSSTANLIHSVWHRWYWHDLYDLYDPLQGDLYSIKRIIVQLSSFSVVLWTSQNQ